MDGKNGANTTAADKSLGGSSVDANTSTSGSRSDMDKNPVICSRPGCNHKASFAWEIANRRPVCAAHARPMEPCGSAGCRRKASHGFRGSRKLEFCVEHATDGMVNLRTKRCGRQGCFKIPTYGVEGSTHREFCAPHAPPNYVNINSQKCIFEGCMIEASFGIGGTGPRKLCAQHFDKNPNIVSGSARRSKPDGNVSAGKVAVKRTEMFHSSDSREDGAAMPVVDPKLCAYEGCPRRRSHGIKGTAKPQFCHEHAEKGMVNVEIQRCDSKGCAKLAKFGTRGSGKREFCARHASPDMVRDGGTGVDPSIGAEDDTRKSQERGSGFSGDFQSSIGENDLNHGGRKRAFDDNVRLSSSSGESESKRPDWGSDDLEAKQRTIQPWPRVSILQTQTGWSRWNWPASLSSCSM